MIPQTTGREYNIGKTVSVQCIKNDDLSDIEIKERCFLMLIIREGSAYFKVGESFFEAIAPSIVCFDESETPKLLRGCPVCDSIYFCPTFLNVNMTFSRMRSGDYKSLASTHDMFILKPFTDRSRYVFPIFDEYLDTVYRLFSRMEEELRVQSDWYWSCRSRSYFIELMLLLERTYGFMGQDGGDDAVCKVSNPHLKKAVIYIDGNYGDSITLEDIVRVTSLNHTTLTRLFRDELGTTPIEYLWNRRILSAKKFLGFTDLPIKEIAARCGFKTPQHFSRRFEAATGSNPGRFRSEAVAKRKQAF